MAMGREGKVQGDRAPRQWRDLSRDADKDSQGEPRPLRRLPDGGGSHSARPVRGHLADDRRTSAAASRINSIARSGVGCPIENDGKGASR